MSYFFHKFLKSISLLLCIFFVSLSAHSQIHFVSIILLVCKELQTMASCLQLNLFNDCSRGTTAEWYFDFTFVFEIFLMSVNGDFIFIWLAVTIIMIKLSLLVCLSIYLFVWHLPIQIKNLVAVFAVFYSVCLLIWMFFCSLSPYLVPWRRLFLLHVSVHILVRSNNWHLLPHTFP